MGDVWSWALPGCRFVDQYPSRAEALAAGRRLHPEEQLATGMVMQVSAGEFFPSADWLASELADNAIDELGDAADDWAYDLCQPDAIRDLGMRLDTLLRQWVQDHGLEPQFWRVVDVELHESCGDEE